MATDATGTPTAKGIPTYNPDGDAPSGQGFNAAMAAIDTLLGWVKLRKNSAGSEFSRGRLNLIEGSGITITVADDAGNNEVDVTFAAGGTVTRRIPIDLHTPRTSSLSGNSFWTVAALTDYDMGHWEFVNNVDGKLYGHIALPKELHGTPNAKIILALAANATTGVHRWQVATKAVAEGETLNPGSLTDETAQDITVPGTAYFLDYVSFTLTETVAADDILVVEIHHNGAHANDTLAVNSFLVGAWLEVDVTS